MLLFDVYVVLIFVSVVIVTFVLLLWLSKVRCMTEDHESGLGLSDATSRSGQGTVW